MEFLRNQFLFDFSPLSSDMCLRKAFREKKYFVLNINDYYYIFKNLL